MSSSIGELVVAMRRNMAKLDKLTQRPAALASLGFLTKQVEATKREGVQYEHLS
jgi:hypothetical protein